MEKIRVRGKCAVWLMQWEAASSNYATDLGVDFSNAWVLGVGVLWVGA